jgi:hypothetical protein
VRSTAAHQPGKQISNIKDYDMEALSIEIINPEAKQLLLNLAKMNLIRIKPKPALSEILATLRRNESEAPSLEEITQEVETVRQAQYDRKVQDNH